MEYARWFGLEGSKVLVRTPGGAVDTLQGPFHALVCMSSSYVGFLHAIGADSTIVGVSGLGFLGERPPLAVEVGYDAALDYEAIVKARPDLFLTYNVGAVEPPYLAKLRELGIRTVVLSEHLESHPLSRAEYVKLFGALTGRSAVADSVFCAVRDRYLASVQPKATQKVLINIPYAAGIVHYQSGNGLSICAGGRCVAPSGLVHLQGAVAQYPSAVRRFSRTG